MPTTTSLKLPAELKAPIADAARQSGKTTHAFMIDALSAQADLFERRQEFVASALAGGQPEPPNPQKL